MGIDDIFETGVDIINAGRSYLGNKGQRYVLQVGIHQRKSVKQHADILKKLGENGGICIDAAHIADHVYKDDGPLTGGWRVSADFPELHSMFNKKDVNGLVSNLYERTIGGRKEYICAFAGTDLTKVHDYIADIEQAVLGSSEQYESALEVAKALSERVVGSGATLYYVGHSLGGGEATLSALVTGHHAFVFNPAGLHPDLMEKHGVKRDMNREKSLVDAFIATHDELNVAQEVAQIRIPTAVGRRWYLDSRKSDKPVVIPGHHMMTRVIGVMKNYVV